MAKKELLVGLGLLILLFIIFNPWNMFMPGYVVMSFLIGAIVLYIAFVTFLWRENHGDEREQFHRLFADRIAYLVGSALLLLGIVVGELQHTLDPWLIYALAFMVIAKIAGLIYGKNKL
jgi:heme O synthase-like polyprenyltransferase